MQIRKDYYAEARRPSSGLRHAVVASVIAHLLLLAGIAAIVHFWASASPAFNVLEVGFMAVGLPDAPEGIESTRDASKPPGPPEAPSVAPPVPEKKPEPPKEEKKPEPKKEPEKKPDPPKEKKPEPRKEEKKEPPKKKKEEKKEPPKNEAKKDPPKKEEKPVALPDANVGDLLEEEMMMARNEDAVLGGGLEGATPSTRAQTGLGDPLSQEQGISIRGVPSKLGSWANQVRRAVKRYWQEPGAVPVGSRVEVVFWVSSGGQLLGEPEVKTPSNDATLDQSGVNAIKLAAPFPPLPPGYDQPRQQVIFVFTISG